MASIGVFQSIFGISEPALGFSPFHKGPRAELRVGSRSPSSWVWSFSGAARFRTISFISFIFFPEPRPCCLLPDYEAVSPFLGT